MSFYEITSENHNYFYFNKVKKTRETLAHFHSAVELLFCVDGSQEVCINGEKIVLSQGEACFVDSYIVHSVKNSGAYVFAIVGDMNFFQPLFSLFGGTPPVVFRYENHDFLDVLLGFHHNNDQNGVARDETNEAIVKLVMSDVSRFVTFSKRKEYNQNELVAGVLRFAMDNYASDLSLENIAKRFGYSRDYISRVLHKYLGVNWNVYVATVRAKAVHNLLLANKNRTVLELAFACGFDSANTFYRAYKRVFGKTPVRNDNL